MRSYELDETGWENREDDELREEILLSYFEQVNGGQPVILDNGTVLEEALATHELSEAMDRGRIRLKWVPVSSGSLVNIVADFGERYVEAVIPESLFDLIIQDSDLYYQINSGVLEKVRERLANWLGSIIGFEAPERVSLVSPDEAALLKRKVSNLVTELLNKHQELSKM